MINNFVSYILNNSQLWHYESMILICLLSTVPGMMHELDYNTTISSNDNIKEYNAKKTNVYRSRIIINVMMTILYIITITINIILIYNKLNIYKNNSEQYQFILCAIIYITLFVIVMFYLTYKLKNNMYKYFVGVLGVTVSTYLIHILLCV